ncbi:uncharacterized protein LOC21385959 [Morus notabilis]|nr:uncharacterized protein LOC21385959 [Morus notabilis]
MDDMLDSEKVLAWLWVIEAMASFKEVGPSLLHDVVQSAPELPDDLGKNTREMIALRCLEDFIAPQDGITSDAPSAAGSKVQFDLSEGCQDVLQRILQETSVSNLRAAGLELSKWDIHPFIQHKRACLPKCALEQLKDAILNGTHQYADFLREKSGLASTSRDNGICRNGNNRDSVTSRPNLNHSDVLNMRVGVNSDPLIIENRNNQLGDNVLPSKRTRPDLADKDMAGFQENCNETNNFDVQHISSKRVKQYASSANESAEQNSVPLHGREPLKDSSEVNVPVATTGHDLAESEMGTMDEGRVLEDRCNECAVTKRSQKSSKNGFHKNLSEVPCNAPQMPQVTSRDEGHQNFSVDEAQGEAEYCAQPTEAFQSLEQKQVSIHGKQPLEDSSQRDLLANVEERMVLEDGLDGCSVSKRSEQVDKSDLPKNDSEVPHNAPEPSGAFAAETAHKSPTKESKSSYEHDLQFLEPNSASCDRLQQEIIAGEAEQDINNCDEEQTSSDNDEHNNELNDLAKKKHEFLSSQCTDNHDSMVVDWTEQNLCMKFNEDGHLLVCNTNNCQLVVHEKCVGSPATLDDKGNFYCPFCAYSIAINEYLEAKKSSSLARKELAAFIRMGSEHRPMEDTNVLNKKKSHYAGGNEDEVFLGKTHENEQVGEREQNEANQVETNVNIDDNNQQAEFSPPRNDTFNLGHREERTSIDSEMLHVTAGEKEGEEKVLEECPSESGTEGEQDEVPGKSDVVSHANTDTDLVNQGIEDLRVQREVLKGQEINASKRFVYEFNINSDDEDDYDDKLTISNYCVKLRGREVPCNFRGIPQSRRKKVPWTVAEEKKLKEAIQKFSHEKKIPWKEILKFGDSVFVKGRTTVDLKDKWRNMSKGTPKSK